MQLKPYIIQGYSFSSDKISYVLREFEFPTLTTMRASLMVTTSAWISYSSDGQTQIAIPFKS